MGNPPPVQHHDSTAHTIPRCLQDALERYLSYPKAKAASFIRRVPGLCCLMSTPVPISLAKELILIPCRDTGLLLITHCTFRYEAAWRMLCLKMGLWKQQMLWKLLVHCSWANWCVWSLHPQVHAEEDRCKTGDGDHYLQLGQSLNGFQGPQDS